MSMRKTKRRLEDEGVKVKMYSRYFDNINILCEKMYVKVEEKADDETIMKWIQKIGNTIHRSIQVTIDHPSNHVNRRMPVLDLEQWIGKSKFKVTANIKSFTPII